MYTVTKRFTFDMGHRLTFHSRCYNLHGHTYTLEVTVVGALDAHGFVMDFSEVKRRVKELVVDRLDHAFACFRGDTTLAEFLPRTDFRVEWFDFETTAENMARWIFETLRNGGLDMLKVRLWETPNSVATYLPDPDGA